jgi:DNA-binding PucR family transcriptional regulator
LDTVLTRYHAGQAKLENVIMRQIEQGGLVDQSAAMRLMVALHDLLNRLTTEIAAEFARETAKTTRSSEQQFSERLQDLLSGSSFDTAGLNYAFDSAWHVCVIAIGPQSDRVIASLATILGRQLLSLPRGTEMTWAWLGGTRPLTIAEVESAAKRIPRATVRLALGEPRQGFDGWRVTHRQAQAALRVAFSDPNPTPLTRFADIALIEPLLRDRALGFSYVDIYLSPLNEAKDHGQTARDTLRAYLGAGQQIEAAAFKLEVHRHTVRTRIEAIEERLGYHISDRHAELAVALDIEALLAGTVARTESPHTRV